MNAQQVKDFLANGGVVNRFTSLKPSARAYVRRQFDAGNLWAKEDGFPNSRLKFAATSDALTA